MRTEISGCLAMGVSRVEECHPQRSDRLQKETGCSLVGSGWSRNLICDNGFGGICVWQNDQSLHLYMCNLLYVSQLYLDLENKLEKERKIQFLCLTYIVLPKPVGHLNIC